MHDPRALVAATLRSHGFRGTTDHADPAVAVVFAFAAGATVERHQLDNALGAATIDGLESAGWIEREPDAGGVDRIRCSHLLFPMGSIITALPRARPGEDHVYVGADSLELLRLVWQLGGHGTRAVDLATGNGFLAAALTTRFRQVIAADLSDRCVSAAALIGVLNPVIASRIEAVCCNVADGLPDGVFDLVSANAPWVPEVELAPTALPQGWANRRFAAGGPTGFELPRQFLNAATRLLAPGGRAFVACLDLRFADGGAPLRDHLPVLEAAGCSAQLHPTTFRSGEQWLEWASARLDDVVSARHVVVELRLPSAA